MSAEPTFLSVAQVRALHERQLGRFGGGSGVREPGLLASAVAQAEASFGGVWAHDGLVAMAAAYLFHLVSNHPFVDGNKRVGLLAGLVFLHVNGVRVVHGSPALYALTMAVAEGRLDKAAVTRELLRIVRAPR
jgi:death on curing protein